MAESPVHGPGRLGGDTRSPAAYQRGQHSGRTWCLSSWRPACTGGAGRRGSWRRRSATMARVIHYEDLVLTIEPDEAESYRVRVLSSPYGTTTEPFDLPFRRQELEMLIQDIGVDLLRCRARNLIPAQSCEAEPDSCEDRARLFRETGLTPLPGSFHGKVRDIYLLSRERAQLRRDQACGSVSSCRPNKRIRMTVRPIADCLTRRCFSLSPGSFSIASRPAISSPGMCLPRSSDNWKSQELHLPSATPLQTASAF